MQLLLLKNSGIRLRDELILLWISSLPENDLHLFDIGSGQNHLIARAKRFGLPATGVDILRDSWSQARAHGLDFVREDWTQLRGPASAGLLERSRGRVAVAACLNVLHGSWHNPGDKEDLEDFLFANFSYLVITAYPGEVRDLKKKYGKFKAMRLSTQRSLFRKASIAPLNPIWGLSARLRRRLPIIPKGLLLPRLLWPLCLYGRLH